MNEIVAQHISNVFLFQAPIWLLWVYLIINLGLTFVHSYQELTGRQWRYLGSIAGVHIPDVGGIALFFVGLTLLLWLVGFVGILGYMPLVGALPTSIVVAALGFLIGGRLGESYFNHVRLNRLGYRPNPALSSTPYYLAEAGLIIVLFLPGLVSNPISVVVGSVLGAGFFFTVLPTLRMLRAIPALQADAWRVE